MCVQIVKILKAFSLKQLTEYREIMASAQVKYAN